MFLESFIISFVFSPTSIERFPSLSETQIFRLKPLCAKIFDWKKRGAYKPNEELPPGIAIIGIILKFILCLSDFILSPSTLSPNPGSTRKRKRVGRGYSAGQGGTAGRGMKGQNSRYTSLSNIMICKS